MSETHQNRLLCVQPENVQAADADTVRVKLKKIMNAVTSEEVNRAVVEFETSPQFTSNKRLSNWFHNKWKPLLTVSKVQFSVDLFLEMTGTLL